MQSPHRRHERVNETAGERSSIWEHLEDAPRYDPQAGYTLHARIGKFDMPSLPISQPLKELLELNGFVLDSSGHKQNNNSTDRDRNRDITEFLGEEDLFMLAMMESDEVNDLLKSKSRLRRRLDQLQQQHRRMWSLLSSDQINYSYRLAYSALRRQHDNETKDMQLRHARQILDQCNSPHVLMENAWTIAAWEGEVVNHGGDHRDLLGRFFLLGRFPDGLHLGSEIAIKQRSSNWDLIPKTNTRSYILKFTPHASNTREFYDKLFRDFIKKYHQSRKYEKFLVAEPTPYGDGKFYCPPCKIYLVPMTMIIRDTEVRSRHFDEAMHHVAHSFMAIIKCDDLFTVPEVPFYRIHQINQFDFNTLQDYLPDPVPVTSSAKPAEVLLPEEEQCVKRMVTYYEVLHRLEHVKKQRKTMNVNSHRTPDIDMEIERLRQEENQCNVILAPLNRYREEYRRKFERKADQLFQIAATRYQAKQAKTY
ncbi:hypothetical protein HDU76_000437 [Blyttiomyces sp. JEL0837]|nr:hypothetical protein HDU76_000437 [Blyttiomyces sp. JEL0837]